MKKQEQGKRIIATAEIREYLTKADPIMGAVIEKHGIIDYELQSDYLTALLSNIVGQQLSGRVADVIWGRVVTLAAGEVTAERVLALDDDALRGTGLSRNKAAYIKNIRYFIKPILQSFYGNFLLIPIPLASLPVFAFLLLGIYGKVIWLITSAIIIGIGHMGIHIEHLKTIKNKVRK